MKWAIVAGLYALGCAWLWRDAVKNAAKSTDWLARRCICCHEPTTKNDAWLLANGATQIDGLCPSCRKTMEGEL